MDKFVVEIPRNCKKRSRPSINSFPCSLSNTTENGSKVKSFKQSYLDMGQKGLGASISCPKCGMVYVQDEILDRDNHEKFCNNSNKVLFTLKGYHIHQIDICDGIVKLRWNENIHRNDSISKILGILRNELELSSDFIDGASLSSMAFLYLSSQKMEITGLILCEKVNDKNVVPLERNQEVTSAIVKTTLETKSKGNMDQRDSFKTFLGIKIMWVHSSYRGRGIATKLIDFARENFQFGRWFSKNDVVFSQPTSMGKLFAHRYLEKEVIPIYP